MPDIYDVIEKKNNLVEKGRKSLKKYSDNLDEKIAALMNQRSQAIEQIDTTYKKKIEELENNFRPNTKPIEQKINENDKKVKQIQENLLIAQCYYKGINCLYFQENPTGKILHEIKSPFGTFIWQIYKGDKPINQYDIVRSSNIAKIDDIFIKETGIKPYRTIVKSFPTIEKAEKYFNRYKQKILSPIKQWITDKTEIAKKIKAKYGEEAIYGFDFRLAFKQAWSGDNVIEISKDMVLFSVYFWDRGKIEGQIRLRYLGDRKFSITFHKIPNKNHRKILADHFKKRISLADYCWMDDIILKIG